MFLWIQVRCLHSNTNKLIFINRTGPRQTQYQYQMSPGYLRAIPTLISSPRRERYPAIGDKSRIFSLRAVVSGSSRADARYLILERIAAMCARICRVQFAYRDLVLREIIPFLNIVGGEQGSVGSLSASESDVVENNESAGVAGGFVNEAAAKE